MKVLSLLVASVLASVVFAQTPAPVAAPVRFVGPGAFDFARLLPLPPAADSIAGRAELDVVLQVQADRTAEQIEWAKLIDYDEVFRHATILGPWFTPENLPVTAAFFKELGDDLRTMDGVAKKPFLRPRPFTVSTAVKPCVRTGTSTSYPSGSAMQALVWAELLADLVPARRDALLARAHRAGWGRLIGGVHFPSDLTAGRVIGEAFLVELRKHSGFRAAFEKVRTEVAAKQRP